MRAEQNLKVRFHLVPPITYLSELFLYSFTGATGDVDIEKITKFAFKNGNADISSASLIFANGKVCKSLNY